MQIICILIAHNMQPNAYNLALLHLLVVAPERPAVDKLLAEKVLVPDVKAA